VSKNNTKTAQPTSEPIVEAVNEETATVLSIRMGKGNRANIFEEEAVRISEAAAAKHQQLSEARQRLAEAKDYYDRGSEFAVQAEQAASRAAIALFEARSGGQITPDEVSGILGDQFGWKAKKDGTNSKTPAGAGEGIRKRIVRAVNAHLYVTGQMEKPDAFFEGLPSDEVQAVLNDLRKPSGGITIWQAYQSFADVKKGVSVRIPAAFNPATIAKMVEQLSEEGAGEKVRQNASLRSAYGGLLRILMVIGTERENEADRPVTAQAAE
jgi:hypothetical protein